MNPVKVYLVTYENTWVYVKTILETDFECDDGETYNHCDNPIVKSMSDAFHALHEREIMFISRFLKGQDELHVCMCSPYNTECYRMYRFNDNSWSFVKNLFPKEEMDD